LTTITTAPGVALAVMASFAIASIPARSSELTFASSGKVYFKRIGVVMKPEPTVYFADLAVVKRLFTPIPPKIT